MVRLSNHSTTIPSTDNDAAPNFKSSSGGWEVVGYQNERGSGLNSPLRLTGQNWFATILQIFHHYGNRTPGAIVETTPVSISLRFEDADKVCLCVFVSVVWCLCYGVFVVNSVVQLSCSTFLFNLLVQLFCSTLFIPLQYHPFLALHAPSSTLYSPFTHPPPLYTLTFYPLLF